MPPRRQETLYKIRNRKERKCSICKIIKPVSEFNKDKHCPDGLYPTCKECRRINTRIRYLNPQTKERIRNWGKVYRKTPKGIIVKLNNIHKRRTVKKEGGVNTNELVNLIEHQKYKCNICKKSIKKYRHLDHILPISKGGKHIIYNLQWLCPECNLRKGSRIISIIGLFN